ncbi:UNVERIFIED_CONTAM: hypothetical protein GTU68_008642 [Idotea baltica]|nr:hypothetical protein [Idotea baltica]
MTGLNPDTDQIIEIATLVTDAELNLLAEGPTVAIQQSVDTMNGMDEWNTRQHGGSGLTERVLSSDRSELDAETTTIEFLAHLVPSGKSPMCGNSICQDRRFMARHMPRLEQFFHYRNLDVSTLKELAVRWKPEALEGFTKQGNHLAMDDIRDSVNELRHYRKTFIAVDG